MKPPRLFLTSLPAILLAFLPIHAHAYEVWMGTLGWQRGMLENPEQWSRTAALVLPVEGVTCSIFEL